MTTLEKSPQFECCFVDTCLPDYWGGHNLPHVSIPAYPMTLDQLKDALKSEINQGAIAGGSDYEYSFFESDSWHNEATKAIDSIKLNDGYTKVFEDIEDSENDFVYAYFVFRPL